MPGFAHCGARVCEPLPRLRSHEANCKAPMKNAAVAKAARKLKRALDALDSLRQSETAEATERAWEDFLMASGSIYAALEEGSKGEARSTPWFGREKHRRKKDPLLRYLHFARNVEEHGLVKIVTRNSSSVQLMSPYAGVALQPNGKNTWLVVGTRGVVKFAHDIVCLAAVTDTRFNDSADPPTTHLGQPITAATPLAVAELGFTYLEAMIANAAALVVDAEE